MAAVSPVWCWSAGTSRAVAKTAPSERRTRTEAPAFTFTNWRPRKQRKPRRPRRKPGG